MIGYIYETTNNVTGKKYIGKRQKPRFQKWYKGSGKIVKLAFEKYGKENFSVVVLEECNSVDELCEAEKRWIAKYKADGVPLYNIAEGGEGGHLNRTWKDLSPERRATILEKNRLAHMGEKNGFYGKHHSQEHKEYISRISRKKPKSQVGAENIRRGKREPLKPIIQVDKATGDVIKEWNSWCEASKALFPDGGRTMYTHIADCCKGKRKSAYGYYWKFA